MAHNRKIILSVLSFFIINNEIYSWEVYDRVIATVNETPIIQSDLLRRFERLTNQKKISPQKIQDEKNRLLDKFIEETLLEQTAERESIIVTPEKIDNQIEKIMKQTGVDSIESFKKKIENTGDITFEEYKGELRKSIIFEQVMSIAIGISPPTTTAAKEWYDSHKKEVGYEVNIQHIKFNMIDDSFSENKRASKEANKIYGQIQKGQSFESLASQYSEDPVTKDNGGKMGWVAVSSIAQNDLTFANNIYSQFIINKKQLAVIKSSSAYHVVKFNGRRVTPFETVKEYIFNMLYQKNMMEQFQKWVARKRLESDIKIFLEDYTEAKSSS